MVKRFILLSILQLFMMVYASEEIEHKVYRLIQEKIYKEFSDYSIVSILPIPKSYLKTLEGKEFDSINCKSKGNSNLYLYLDCEFINDNQPVSSFPVTVRIKEGSKVLIEKNKKVDILYIDKNIKIKMLGVSLKSGKLGDYIEVKNLSTGKILKGKVISDSEVLIEP